VSVAFVAHSFPFLLAVAGKPTKLKSVSGSMPVPCCQKITGMIT
jgi:hypothetical protein